MALRLDRVSSEEPHPAIVDFQTMKALGDGLHMRENTALEPEKIAKILHKRYPDADYDVVDQLLAETNVETLRAQIQQYGTKTE